MRIGINATSPAGLALCDQLWSSVEVGYVELMLDNFVHLPPKTLIDHLAGRPVAIHIMSSMFLHRTDSELKQLAQVYRNFFEPLDPLYVSDHLGIHEVAGRRLPEMIDVDYSDRALLDRCAVWQDALGRKIHLENYASTDATRGDQVTFFEALNERAGVGILFDISNAVVAERNGGAPVNDWEASALPIDHCHISGFTRAALDSGLYIDSHNALIDPASWRLLDGLITRGKAPSTLTVEHDDLRTVGDWVANISTAARR